MYATRRQASPQNPTNATWGVIFADEVPFAKTAGYISIAKPVARMKIAIHANRVK
jgi:hypothetical protein